MLYRIFGYFIRRDACRLAALAIAKMDLDVVGIAPGLWSLTVFFESYLMSGASGTSADFGPKEPVELTPVRDSAA